jgi:hypothetical protein
MRDIVFFENEFLSRQRPAMDLSPASPSSIELLEQQPQFSSRQIMTVDEEKCDSSISLNNNLHETEDSSSDNVDQNTRVPSADSDSTDSVEIETVRRSNRNTVPNKLICNNEFVVNQANLCRRTDRTTIEEALQSPVAEKWKCAIEEEIHAHTENKTCTPCAVPDDKKAIKCRWVFKTKLKSDGQIERYKVRGERMFTKTRY